MPLYRAELLAKKPLRYAALIHDVSQVLYLPFDWDDGSYARDRSGYNNHGTIYGPARAGGKIGMARALDGVDDYMEVPHSASLNITNFLTIGTWVNPSVNNRVQGIACKLDFGLRQGYEIRLDYNHVSFRLYDGTTNYDTTATNVIPSVNVWYHLVGTYDGAKAKVYVNGKLEAEYSFAITIAGTTQPLLIGNRQKGYAYFFSGTIDEVRIYSRPLSQDEICMLMFRRLV